MSQISSPWHDKFPKYYDNAKKRIKKIRRRRDNKIPVPYVEDDDKSLWQVKKKSNKFIYTGKIKLRDILYRLQYFAHFNESETDIAEACTIKMRILGKKSTTFTLEESKVGDSGRRGWQICIRDANGDMPTYVEIMAKLEKIDSGNLANAILKALETALDDQDRFELKDYSHDDVHYVRMFILLTHIAEAAVPSKEALKHYSKLVKKRDGNTEIKPKHGRTPMMDKIVRAKLKKIADAPTFSTEFSKEAFPSKEESGTQRSREHALKGNETNPLSDIEKETDPISDSEDETESISDSEDETDPISDIEDEPDPIPELTTSLANTNANDSDNN